MKVLFIITLLFTLNLSSNELSWVDEQINAIKPSRNGVKSYTISRLKDPFVFLKKKTSKAEEKNEKTNKNSSSGTTKPNTNTNQIANTQRFRKGSFNLSAIMNHSAFINGNWYKLNEQINGYKLVRVESSFVILTKKGKNLLLSTNNKNPNIKFKNK